ncbi:MAG: outer membrane beta-barrel protein [Acidobacteria bacterium]|nr:outer membrane beta-barrel protein [Acidobacteriota bacterium]
MNTKRVLGWVVCALLVTAAIVPNALAHPNPRITVLFGGSFIAGERTFDLNGDSYVSQFLNGGKFRLRGSLDLSKHWTLEGDYSFGRNDQRITQDTGGVIEQRDFKVNVGQVQLNFVRFFTDNESRIRPFFSAGLGAVRFNPTDEAKSAALSGDFLADPTQLTSSIDISFAVGGGLEARLNRWLGLRFDLKDHMSAIPRFGLEESSSGPGGIFFPVNGIVHNVEAAAGIVFYFF